MYKDLYSSISPACCYISVAVDGELVSEGTGFAFLKTGEVLTAAHVVTGRFPIRPEDYQDPKQKIMCKFPHKPATEYRAGLCGMNIHVPGFSSALQIDLAILEPCAKPSVAVNYLVTSPHPPHLGELVFAAGYSDELAAPFLVDQVAPGGAAAMNEASGSLHGGYMADLTGPIIKRGHIANVVRTQSINSATGLQVDCEWFYIDNSVHTGASGGPVCNVHGEAVGIVIQRSVTSASQDAAPRIQVPSGCTVGIGLQPLRALSSPSVDLPA